MKLFPNNERNTDGGSTEANFCSQQPNLWEFNIKTQFIQDPNYPVLQ